MDEILEQKAGDYYMDVREFKTGGVEMILRTIKPMHDAAIKSVADPLSWSNYCKENNIPVNIGVDKKFHFADEAEPSDFERDANRRRAVRRSKQQIRWQVRQMGADRLLTLTYRGVMDDRKKLERDFQRFRRLIKKGWSGHEGLKEWRYIAVPEVHESGGYHIHVAIKGWQRITFLRAAWYKALGGTGKETGEMTPGNVDVTSPRKARWGTQMREWKPSRLAGYLTKYISKTFDEKSTEKRRYWHSRDLVLPVKERFVLAATDLVAAIKEAAAILYFNYGFDLDFTRSWLSRQSDALWLSLGET